MRWMLAIALAGCGSHANPKPAVAAPQPEHRVAVAPAPTTVPATPTTPTPIPALPTCTDGGGLAGATASADALRFCLEEDKQRQSCWSLAIAGSTITPLASADALSAGQPIFQDGDREPGPWTANVVEQKAVEICGTDGCKPFAIRPGKSPDDDAAFVEDAAVSASGKHVAVARGLPGIAKLVVETYDRATGKRLGVAKPKTGCVSLQGFANETAVAVEWDCANQGGDRILIAPTGNIIARIPRLSARADAFAQIDGDRWAFSEIHTASIEIYDVATGKRLGGRELQQFARVATHGGRAFAIEPEKARVFVFDRDGKQLATARVPTCRYEWETESVGPLRLLVPATELTKAIGPPTKKSKPDELNMYTTTWTFAGGVTATVRPNYVNPVTGDPVPPWLVVGFAIAAPSKHRIHGVGIGSTLAELRAALGAHEVTSQTSDTKLVAGNADEGAGIVFTLAAGKVTGIQMGD